MAYDNDPDAPNRSTSKKGSVKPRKPRTSAGGAAPGGGRYAGLSAAQRWARNPHHTISYAQHQGNVAAKRQLGTLDLTAPPSASQAITEANSAADLQFGPAIRAAQQQQANVSPWFSDYLARVAGYAQTAARLNAPVLAQAQGYQEGAAAQLPPGLDPNSDAGKQAAQAASGRQALGQLGLDAENANAQATQDYFGGQQAIAARELPQAQAAANADLAFAQSQRGAAITSFLTQARQNAQNYAVARGTLNLNSDKAAADVDLGRGVDPVTGQPLPTKPETAKSSGPFAGLTDSEIAALSPAQKQQMRDDYEAGQHPDTGSSKPKGLTPAQAEAKREREAAALDKRRSSSNTEASKITDIIGRVPTYGARKVKTGVTVTNPDKSTTEQTRAAGPEDVRNWLLADGFSADEIALALKLRSGKKLTAADQATAHRLGITHIPRAWLSSRTGSTPGVSDHPSTPGTKNDPYGSGPGHN